MRGEARATEHTVQQYERCDLVPGRPWGQEGCFRRRILTSRIKRPGPVYSTRTVLYGRTASTEPRISDTVSLSDKTMAGLLELAGADKTIRAAAPGALHWALPQQHSLPTKLPLLPHQTTQK